MAKLPTKPTQPAATEAPENSSSKRGLFAALVIASLAVAAALYINDTTIPKVTRHNLNNEPPITSTTNESSPHKYTSRHRKSQSKRMGVEKQASSVTFGSPIPPNPEQPPTLADLGLPYVNYMHKTPIITDFRPMAGKFRSFKPYRLEMRWDDGTAEGTFSGHISPNGFTSTNTYTKHVFIFVDTRGGMRREVIRFEMRDDRHLMIIEPDEDDINTFKSQAYKDSIAEQAFMKKYFDKHNTPWLAYYPREVPRLPLWPADYLGQTHKVVSYQGFYNCDPTESDSCYDPTPVPLDLVVVATSPRVLVMENLMSEWECEHIMRLGNKVIKPSTVGDLSSAFGSDTRTSENGWLTRHTDAVLDTIYRRFADVLNVRDEDLEHDVSGENLQVVRYLTGQKYSPHHDFGYTGRPHQRFLTLLLYLQVPEEGGETSFPKAFGGLGLNVRPPKGSGALFYSMLPDGNADDMSLHAGNPVLKGNKWICNLWVWDPEFNGQ